MDAYEVELEPGEPDRVAAVVPAQPGLLLLGRDVDEVLELARAAIAFYLGDGLLPMRLIVSRQMRGERLGRVDNGERPYADELRNRAPLRALWR